MRAMPAGGKGMFGLRIGPSRTGIYCGLPTCSVFDVFPEQADDVDLPFPKSQRGLDRFGQARSVFFRDRDAVLNDLDTRPQALDLGTAINADYLAVQPNAQITLLLEKFEEFTRLGFGRNSDPESDEDGARVILSGAKRSGRIPLRYLKGSIAGSLDFARDDRIDWPFEIGEHLIGNRFRGLRSNFTSASGTKSAGNAGPEQLQIIVDFGNRADGRA